MHRSSNVLGSGMLATRKPTPLNSSVGKSKPQHDACTKSEKSCEPPRTPRKLRQFGPGCPLTLPADARFGYDNVVGNTAPKRGCVNAWQVIPTNTSAKRLDTLKTVVGRSPRQVEGRIFSEHCGVLKATAVAVDSESIRRRAARTTTLDAFAAPSMAVHTEGATS